VHGAALDIKDIDHRLKNSEHEFTPLRLPRTIAVHGYLSLLLQAVKNGHLITWPGLTEQAINKHLKMMPATAMGHMHQRRQNIRSTSKVPITSDIEDESVTPAGSGSKSHLVYAVVIDQGQLYTDLTGIFPVRSSKGN
jgi:hypothetical protein